MWGIKRLRQILHWLVFPGVPWVVLLVLLGIGGLSLTFTRGLEETLFGYVSYTVSAWALTVLVAALVRGVPRLFRRVEARPLAGRLIHDEYFRVRTGLAVTFAINAAYALYRIASAVAYSSFWHGALGCYYLLLCVGRLYLTRRMSPALPHTRTAELRVLRATGIYLLVLNLSLAAIAWQIVEEGHTYEYPGHLIYAAAAFCFYSLTMAIINTVRYRHFDSPLLAAAQSIATTTALVSLFSLETAMLSRFGHDPVFDQGMIFFTGLGVVLLAVVQSVFVFVRAWYKLARIKRARAGQSD